MNDVVPKRNTLDRDWFGRTVLDDAGSANGLTRCAARPGYAGSRAMRAGRGGVLCCGRAWAVGGWSRAAGLLLLAVMLGLAGVERAEAAGALVEGRPAAGGGLPVLFLASGPTGEAATGNAGEGETGVDARPGGPTAGGMGPGIGGEVDRRLASPRATMRTFLEAIERLRVDSQGWADAVMCLDLSSPDLGPVEPRDLVRQLYGILNRIEYVDFDQLPSAAQVAESGLDSFVFFPREGEIVHWTLAQQLNLRTEEIRITRGVDGAWRFDPATVEMIPRLYRLFEPLASVAGRDEQFLTAGDRIAWWIEQNLSRTLARGEFLGVAYWQWLSVLLAIMVGVLIDFSVRGVLWFLLARFARSHEAQTRGKTLRDTVRPFGIASAAVFWLVLVSALDLPEFAEAVLLTAIRVLLVLGVSWSAWRLTDLLCEVLAYKASKTKTKMDDILVPLLRKALKVFIVAVGLVYAANSLRIDIVPLLTGLGIGGLAFAFAAKDTIENFFGSVAVILDRPFEIGDWVVIGEAEGIVEEMGFRSTRIRTFYNSQITMPNASLVRATVDNYGRRRYRRWFTQIGVQYNTSPDQLLAFTEGIRELIRRHPYTRKDYYQVYLNEFASSSLNIMLYVFFEVGDWAMELRERERLFLDILRLADQLKVSFAFPTQTVHLFRGQSPTEPAYRAPDTESEGSAMNSGKHLARRLVARQPWRKSKPGAVEYAAEPEAPEVDPKTGEVIESFIEDRSAGG